MKGSIKSVIFFALLAGANAELPPDIQCAFNCLRSFEPLTQCLDRCNLSAGASDQQGLRGTVAKAESFVQRYDDDYL